MSTDTAAQPPMNKLEPAGLEAAKRIFEVMCGGPVDWAKHAADTNEDNLFQSADWATCLAYANAALSALNDANPLTTPPVHHRRYG